MQLGRWRQAWRILSEVTNLEVEHLVTWAVAAGAQGRDTRRIP